MMALASAILVAILFGTGIYLTMKRSGFEVLLGIALLSQGTNFLILASSGWGHDRLPPVLTEKAAEVQLADGVAHVSQINEAAYMDPLPQALILTAIVIGFGLISYLMVLVTRAYETNGSLTLDNESAGEKP